MCESIPLVSSIPWVHEYTMSPCLYHDSMSITWVHVYTMSPSLYHEHLSIPCVHVYTMSPCQYRESMSITRNYWYPKIHVTEIQKYKWQKYKLQKYKTQNYRNTNNRISEIQFTDTQIHRHISTMTRPSVGAGPNENLQISFIGYILKFIINQSYSETEVTKCIVCDIPFLVTIHFDDIPFWVTFHFEWH